MNQPALTDLASHPALVEALATRFGGASLDGLEPIGGGMSGALLAKVTIGGRPYVLRIPRASGVVGDAKQELTCMGLAAERGIAPRVHYTNLEQGVSISDFVEAPTMVGVLRAGGDRSADLGRLLRKLHDGPAFPPGGSAAAACRKFASALEAMGAKVEGATLDRVERIEAALAPHRTLAPCHNDVNPGNVLVDGETMYLVDWQAAGQGDPFHDLVAPGLFSPRGLAQQATLVRAYLGREPTEPEEARLFLTRAMALTMLSLCFAAIARHMPPRPLAPGEPVTPLSDPKGFGEAMEREAKAAFEGEGYARAVAALG